LIIYFSIYCFIKDVAGNIRKDSLKLYLFANVDDTFDSVRWVKLPNLQHASSLVTRNDSILVEVGDSLLMSSNGGMDWETLGSAKGYHGLRATPSGVIFLGNVLFSFDFGRTTSGMGSILNSSCDYPAQTYDEYCRMNTILRDGTEIATAYWYCSYRGVVQSSSSGTFKKSIAGKVWEPYHSPAVQNITVTDSNETLVGIWGPCLMVDTVSSTCFDSTYTEVAFSDKFYFVAVKSQGVFVSSDQGRSWEKTGLIFDNIQSIPVINDNEVCIVSPYDNTYYSSDRGKNWYGISAGLLSPGFAVSYDPGKYLYSVGWSGIYRTKDVLPLSTPKPISTLTRPVIGLSDNPVLGTTTFIFTTTHRSNTTILIYDALGRVLKENDLGIIESGPHKFIFNAESLPSGTYTAELRGAELKGYCRFIVL